jgi:hypothetical protein
MNRSGTALIVVAGVAAAVTVAAIAAVAAPHHHSSAGSSNASGDVDMQALAQLGADATAAPSGSAGPGRHGPGQMPGLGMLGGILHGDVVVEGKDGKPVEVAVQRGTVTSVSGGTLVVRSSDGFEQTWTTSSDTRFLLGGAFARGPWLRGRPGGSEAPPAAPTRSTQPSASSVAKGATVLVLGRANGSKPAATLVLSGPALRVGAGGHPFLPGGGPRWPMRPGMGGPGHHFDQRLPASPKPSASGA